MSIPRFLTVGHSDQQLDAFIELLLGAGVARIADVRRLPGSRRHPQFNEERLRSALPAAGIDYRRIPALAGRRPVSRTVPFEVNAFWQNRSFHNYADYALSPEFEDGLGELRSDATAGPTAVMCSEAVWWRCHRRIIADHLIAEGETPVHLFPGGRVEPARLPDAAVVADGTVRYPAA